MTPELKGKLDTMATKQAAMSAAVAVVNGPEDEPLDWHAIDWRAVEEDVRRLRQRICTGLLEPDARKACKSGSEGGRAQQCARPTRRTGRANPRVQEQWPPLAASRRAGPGRGPRLPRPVDAQGGPVRHLRPCLLYTSPSPRD